MEGANLTSKYGIFKEHSIQTLLSMTYTSVPNEVITGTFSGDVYIWMGNALVTSISAHKGPVYSVLYCSLGLVTSGKDGKLNIWDNPSLNSIFRTIELSSTKKMVVR